MAVVANQIEGKLVGVFISTVLPPTAPEWKELVCGEDAGIDGSKETNSRTTKCGTLKTTGPASWTLNGSFTANTDPDADELSADDMINIFQDDTDVLVKLQHATTAALYTRIGRGSMSAYSETANVNDPVTGDFTIEISGDLTLVEA